MLEAFEATCLGKVAELVVLLERRKKSYIFFSNHLHEVTTCEAQIARSKLNRKHDFGSLK